MITEDYVSFEIAKLLKEKGFDEKTCGFYHDDYNGALLVSNPSNHNGSINSVSAPTQGHTMKWLREVYNLIIELNYNSELDFGFRICRMCSNYPVQLVTNDDLVTYPHTYYHTYEEACEAAIKYCLEHLI